MDKNNEWTSFTSIRIFSEALVDAHFWIVWRFRTQTYLSKYYMPGIVLGQAIYVFVRNKRREMNCFSLATKMLFNGCKGVVIINDINYKICTMRFDLGEGTWVGRDQLKNLNAYVHNP